jgi:hypothetical protein
MIISEAYSRVEPFEGQTLTDFIFPNTRDSLGWRP